MFLTGCVNFLKYVEIKRKVFPFHLKYTCELRSIVLLSIRDPCIRRINNLLCYFHKNDYFISFGIPLSEVYNVLICHPSNKKRAAFGLVNTSIPHSNFCQCSLLFHLVINNCRLHSFYNIALFSKESKQE